MNTTNGPNATRFGYKVNDNGHTHELKGNAGTNNAKDIGAQNTAND